MLQGAVGRIEDLDWECVDADTQYLTHSIHRYSSKFIPQIGRQAIQLLTQPGDLVLDPYCGSGTVLLECSLSQRRSIGIDLNPVAVLISKVKTTPVGRARLQDFVQRMEARLIPGTGCGHSIEEMMGMASRDPRCSDSWYRKWFRDDVLLELIAIDREIAAERDAECRDIARVAFSDILRRCSNAHQGYPNVMLDKNRGMAPLPAPEFTRRLREISRSVGELDSALAGAPISDVIWGRAESIALADCSVDAVITHPPYIGSVPYAEYGLLSLVWLGHDPKRLDEELTGGKRHSADVVERFEAGLRGMLRESLRVLKPGAFLFMVLGDPTVRGDRVDLRRMATRNASSLGFGLAAEHHRQGINRRANLMGRESLLFFRKDPASRQVSLHHA